jgi:hypothetical protein
VVVFYLLVCSVSRSAHQLNFFISAQHYSQIEAHFLFSGNCERWHFDWRTEKGPRTLRVASNGFAHVGFVGRIEFTIVRRILGDSVDRAAYGWPVHGVATSSRVGFGWILVSADLKESFCKVQQVMQSSIVIGMLYA